jgi:hypothetical protein
MFSCVKAVNEPENTPLDSEIQYRRAVWIARRFNLSPIMARAVASLAFQETTR